MGGSLARSERTLTGAPGNAQARGASRRGGRLRRLGSELGGSSWASWKRRMVRRGRWRGSDRRDGRGEARSRPTVRCESTFPLWMRMATRRLRRGLVAYEEESRRGAGDFESSWSMVPVMRELAAISVLGLFFVACGGLV